MVIARAGERCERCGAPGADIHHRRARGMGGSRDPHANLPGNLVLLCRGCHDWIESRRSWAYGQGWLIPHDVRINPETVSVPTAMHGRVLLADDGSVIPA